MKFLAFTDIHSDLYSLKEIVKKAKKEKIDFLVCAGDLTSFGSGLDYILKKLDIGIPLILIPGNHEVPKQIEKAEKKFKFIHNIHGKAYSTDSVTFFGCGGSSLTPFNTPHELKGKNFKNLLKFKDTGKKLIFLVHEPPFDTKLDVLDKHIGNVTFRKFIEEHNPIYCICGHLHENEGKKDKIKNTIVLNPGPKGEIIEI